MTSDLHRPTRGKKKLPAPDRDLVGISPFRDVKTKMKMKIKMLA